MNEYTHMHRVHTRTLIYRLIDRRDENKANHLVSQHCGMNLGEVLALPLVSTKQLFNIIDMCCLEEALGVEMCAEAATNFSVTSLGLVAGIALSSATVRDAISQVQAFEVIFSSDSTFRLATQTLDNGDLLVTSSVPPAEASIRATAIYQIIQAGMGNSLMHSLTGTNRHGAVISLPTSQPHYWQRISSSFQCQINFVPDDSAGKMLVPKHIADRESVTANEKFHKLAMEIIEPWLRSKTSSQPFSRLVAMSIASQLPSPATLTACAKKMGISERTLRRRLQYEGTSFQRVKHDTTRTLALNLAENGVSQKEAAIRIGKQSQHFSRWFQEATGYRYRDHNP